MPRFRPSIFIANTLLAAIASAAEPPATSPAAKQVMIDNFSFTPAELTIHVGDTVTWKNRDDVPHTVVSVKPDKSLRSDALDTDDTFSHQFTAAGTVSYFCSIHTHMTGKIIVLPAERK